jgi:aromatic ring-opening dioxygenase catalytic subunit (LigB family)
MARMPTYFLSHGGGPWPWLDGPFRRQFDALEKQLVALPAELPRKPVAVLVVTGHWEEPQFTVGAAERPGMIYDYSGFPAHTYQIEYSAPGAPHVAQRVLELLEGAGIAAALDEQRGFDHGTFTPLAVMYPQADVPVVQLSLKRGYDPQEHLDVGRALAPLRDEGVLIVGSGLSWHNLRMFGPAAKPHSSAFDAWLHEALVLQPQERTARIVQWDSAPAARIAHPQEDHLAPLFMALGAAERDVATRVYHEEGFMGGVTASSYRFGDQRAAAR